MGQSFHTALTATGLAMAPVSFAGAAVGQIISTYRAVSPKSDNQQQLQDAREEKRPCEASMTDQPCMRGTGHPAVIAALIGIIFALAPSPLDARGESAKVKVPLVMPADARKGKEIFDANCRRCHGRNLSGTDKGPALILYERSHHGDGMFFQAVRSGVRAHHWKLGDMPPLEKVTDDDVALVIRYVRELQKFNENDRAPPE